LQIRNLDAGRAQLEFDEDLTRLEPDPTPAPAWAQHW
jgi:hypothetical protein